MLENTDILFSCVDLTAGKFLVDFHMSFTIRHSNTECKFYIFIHANLQTNKLFNKKQVEYLLAVTNDVFEKPKGCKNC